jgi:hypothetical protein
VAMTNILTTILALLVIGIAAYYMSKNGCGL